MERSEEDVMDERSGMNEWNYMEWNGDGMTGME